MSILKIVILLRSLRDYNRVARNTIASINILKLRKLRINTSLPFRIVKAVINFKHEYWYATSIKKKIINRRESRILKHVLGVDAYLRAITDTIPSCSIVSPVNNTSSTNWLMVCNKYSPKPYTERVARDTLYRTCLLAVGMRDMFIYSEESAYLDYYVRLLGAVNLCVIFNSRTCGIQKHPIMHVSNNLGDVTMADISGLVLLIADFGNISDQRVVDVEKSIKTSYNAVMNTHDYFITNAHNDHYSFDLHPNALYTPTKCLLYIASRLSQGLLDTTDCKILKSLLETSVTRIDTVTDTDTRNVLIEFRSLLAVTSLWSKNQNSDIDNILSYDMLLTLSLKWLLRITDTRESVNPELESVICKINHLAGNTATAETHQHNALRVMNILYESGVLRKTNTTAELLASTGVASRRLTLATLPNIYVNHKPDYWEYGSAELGTHSGEYPMFDYLITYSRMLKK